MEINTVKKFKDSGFNPEGLSCDRKTFWIIDRKIKEMTVRI